MQATIRFGDDELIENVAIGDSNAWQVTPNKRANLLFVKPLADRATTNMTVVTDARTYLFQLSPGSVGDAPYTVRFRYPPPPEPTQPDAVADAPGRYKLSGTADIRPDESSYIGWHNGTGTGTYVDGEYGGLELTGKVQILNGFDENADNGDLRELIDDGISWSSGNAYFQIPLFYTADDDSQQFTTLRPATSAAREAA